MKQSSFGRPTSSSQVEGSRSNDRQTGKVGLPPARSLTPARDDRSTAREPGDLQLALPGLVSGEHSREGEHHKPGGHGLKESDGVVVPEKPTNLVRSQGAGGGKDPGQGKHDEGHPRRAQDRRYDGKSGLRRVGEKARKEAGKGTEDRETLVNLFTHLRVDLLREVFFRLRKGAAAGVETSMAAAFCEGLHGARCRLRGL